MSIIYLRNFTKNNIFFYINKSYCVVLRTIIKAINNVREVNSMKMYAENYLPVHSLNKQNIQNGFFNKEFNCVHSRPKTSLILHSLCIICVDKLKKHK